MLQELSALKDRLLAKVCRVGGYLKSERANERVRERGGKELRGKERERESHVFSDGSK